MYPMTPEQIKKHEPMNINNLLEKVPVEKELPPVDKSDRDWEILEWSIGVFVDTQQGGYGAFYAYREKVWYSNGKIISGVTHWYRPVTRESLEEWLREFGEKVVKKTMESHYRYVGGFTENPKVDMQAALTELINKTLGQ